MHLQFYEIVNNQNVAAHEVSAKTLALFIELSSNQATLAQRMNPSLKIICFKAIFGLSPSEIKKAPASVQNVILTNCLSLICYLSAYSTNHLL
jgi:hypothetical protein